MAAGFLTCAVFRRTFVPHFAWFHVAFVYDGTQSAVFVSGRERLRQQAYNAYCSACETQHVDCSNCPLPFANPYVLAEGDEMLILGGDGSRQIGVTPSTPSLFDGVICEVCNHMN